MRKETMVKYNTQYLFEHFLIHHIFTIKIQSEIKSIPRIIL